MLPYADRAYVDPAKLRDYLLSTTHPLGQHKAVVFASLGFRRSNWTALRAALLQHSRSENAVRIGRTHYGETWRVSGTIIGPNGRVGRFASIWMIQIESVVPRLLTAYPE